MNAFSRLARTFRTATALTICGVGALGLSACESDQSDQTASGGPTSIHKQSLTAETPTPNPAVDPLGKADPTMKTKAAEAPAKLVPVAMRTGTHQGFDRVVFELTGEGTPGWRVDYSATPAQQASGQNLEVAGDTFLNVNIDGTTYPFELGVPDPELPPVVGTGPAVAQVVSGGTFEGRSQFIIGLNGPQRPYSVSFLEDPKRLVIDFQQN